MSKNDLYMISVEDFEGKNSKIQTIKNNSIDKTFTIPENVNLVLWFAVPIISNDNIIWHNNYLYICGVTGEGKPYIGKLKSDGKTFETLTPFDDKGSISTMTLHNNDLYIGGIIGGAIDDDDGKPYVGKLKSDGKTFEDISLFDDEIGWITTMTSHDNTLYIGGVIRRFGGGGGKPYVGKLKSDGKTFEDISPTFDDEAGMITTMTSHDNTLYIGGFSDDLFDGKPYVGKLKSDGKTFEDISPFDKGYITTMTLHDNTLYIGGVIGDFSDDIKPYIGKLKSDGKTFEYISPFDDKGYITTMTLHDNTLYIGGFIGKIGDAKPYVGKLKSDGKTFEDIIGTKDGEKGLVGALYSPPKDKDEEEDNIALILGLVLGLGLGLPLLVYFYLKMKK